MTDFLTFALPLIFVFAVVYGALEVSKVFKNKRVNGLIALVIAFFAIGSEQVTNLIYQILPAATILFIIVFFLGFIFAPFKKKEGEKRDFTLIIMVAALVLVLLVTQGYDWISDILPYNVSSENFMYAGGLILIIAILYAAYKKGGGEGGAPKPGP